jgi:hypothetical protein
LEDGDRLRLERFEKIREVSEPSTDARSEYCQSLAAARSFVPSDEAVGKTYTKQKKERQAGIRRARSGERKMREHIILNRQPRTPSKLLKIKEIIVRWLGHFRNKVGSFLRVSGVNFAVNLWKSSEGGVIFAAPCQNMPL